MDLYTMLNNKKILFYGPANTNDKKTININFYDYVIITNNMISSFFSKYSNITCKIIHYTNTLYTKNYIELIKFYSSLISLHFVSGYKSYKIITKHIKTKNIKRLKSIPYGFKRAKGIPFILTRLLLFLKYFNFKQLYITGCTFYSSNNINDCYEEKEYIIKEAKYKNIFTDDKNIHNLKYNKYIVKKILKQNPNIKICKELKDVLC